MKLTPTAAMRARDVSRPRAEHLAEAETAEAARRAGPRAAPAAGDDPRKPAEGDGRRFSRSRRSWSGSGRDGARRR
ncbi:MAG TPA: hypothetical protein VFV73_19415 [Streptosporangiaceae bacterium]|nr:hypothetical protein [Streptosporangiaceae bacterium]